MNYINYISVIYIVYLVLMSFVTFIMFRRDKIIAKKNSNNRIKEKILLALVVFGGAIGGYFGRTIMHHKTEKSYFSITIYYSMLLQIAIGAMLVILSV